MENVLRDEFSVLLKNPYSQKVRYQFFYECLIELSNSVDLHHTSPGFDSVRVRREQKNGVPVNVVMCEYVNSTV